MHAIRVALGKRPDVVLWRNQSGAVRVAERWQRYGLQVGASDLIGILKPSGRFIALEVKTTRGVVAKEQVMFLDLVNSMGGVGRIVRSVEDAIRAVEEANAL